MDTAHLTLCILGVLLLAPCVVFVACGFAACMLSSRISRQEEQAPQQPHPPLDPMGSFDEQADAACQWSDK